MDIKNNKCQRIFLNGKSNNQSFLITVVSTRCILHNRINSIEEEFDEIMCSMLKLQCSIKKAFYEYYDKLIRVSLLQKLGHAKTKHECKMCISSMFSDCFKKKKGAQTVFQRNKNTKNLDNDELHCYPKVEEKYVLENKYQRKVRRNKHYLARHFFSIIISCVLV